MMLPNINKWRLEIALWLVPNIFKTPAPADAGAFREGYRNGMEEAAKICDELAASKELDEKWFSKNENSVSWQAFAIDEAASAIRYRAEHG